MTTTPDSLTRSSNARWFAALGLFGALERLALWLVYSPVSYGDTPTYLRLANVLGTDGLAGYDATRVPGYPLFLLLLDGELDRVWAAQLVLGWGVSLLLFWIAWKVSADPRLGFAIGMLYNLVPGLFLFEANLLSETLTMFTIIASLALFVAVSPRSVGRPPNGQTSRRSTWGVLLLLGLVAGAAGLVRALFYVLAPWLAILLLWGGEQTKDKLSRVAVFAIGPALLLGGWLGFVFTQYEMLAPTTMGGYHLVQHTGEYFELLPDEHAVIRDTYLKYRDARVAERGVQTNAIWDAIPELSEVTGHSFFALSAEMQRLSLQLIRQYPDLYLRNVINGWIDFWKAPAIWEPESLRSDDLAGVFAAWVILGRGLSLIANAAFLALSLTVVALKRVRARVGADSFFVATAGLVWIASIIQTLVDHGDNPRFLVPLQIVVIFVIVRSAYHFMKGAPLREHR